MSKRTNSSRWWLRTDSTTQTVNASPEALYALVADLTRMGEWSPECARVEWADGATGAVDGARFVGHNQTGPRGLIKWSRKGRVLVAEPGREFAFVTEEGGREGVVWRYRFEPVETGTLVTESYDVEWIPTWARIVDVFGNRSRDLQRAMQHTLTQLKQAAETAARSAGTRS